MSRATKLALIPAVLLATSCSSSTDARGNPITSVTIATPPVVLSQAATQLIQATIRDADGNTMETVSGVTWTSANNAVVSVTQGGEVRGVALGGPVNVTVSVEGKSATVPVTVVPAKIDITPGTATLALNGSRQLSGVPLDNDGNPIAGAGTITWTSNNHEVATVSSTGLVNTVAIGNALISASAAGRTSTLNLEIGVSSTLDGHWTGTSTTQIPNQPVRIYPVDLDVVFGSLRAFRFVFIGASACSVERVALIDGTASIVNSGFTFSLVPPHNSTAGVPSTSATVSGTFGSLTSMTANHTAFSFGILDGCSGSIGAGTITATRQ